MAVQECLRQNFGRAELVENVSLVKFRITSCGIDEETTLIRHFYSMQS